jgi:hypothetical protein
MEVQSDKQDRLREAIQLCTIHHERMSFAYGKIEKYFPLTRETRNIVTHEYPFITEKVFEGSFISNYCKIVLLCHPKKSKRISTVLLRFFPG